MAGHGAVIAEETVKRVVQVAISLVTNAALVLQPHLFATTQKDSEPLEQGPAFGKACAGRAAPTRGEANGEVRKACTG